MTTVNSIATTPAAKIASLERIKIIDVLRGFALLGITIVHMAEQYYAGDNSIFVNNTSLDTGILIFMSIFIIGKFFPIFPFFLDSVSPSKSIKHGKK